MAMAAYLISAAVLLNVRNLGGGNIKQQYLLAGICISISGSSMVHL